MTVRRSQVARARIILAIRGIYVFEWSIAVLPIESLEKKIENGSLSANGKLDLTVG